MRYKWFKKGQRPADEPGLAGPGGEAEPKAPVKGKYSHGEKAGLVLFAAMLCWGMYNGDLPMVFFGLAFIIYELRPLAEALLPGPGKALSNVMQGFSLALAVGALVWVFL